MRYLFVVPFLAFVLAVFAHVEAPAYTQALDRELVPDHVLVEPAVIEVPLFALEPTALASGTQACTSSDVEAQHDFEASTAVRLGSQVPARRWFHHEHGCVAF